MAKRRESLGDLEAEAARLSKLSVFLDEQLSALEEEIKEHEEWLRRKSAP